MKLEDLWTDTKPREKCHAILKFQCPLTIQYLTAAIAFCSHSCRRTFSERLEIRHRERRGSLVERLAAIKFNELKKCAECEYDLKKLQVL